MMKSLPACSTLTAALLVALALGPARDAAAQSAVEKAKAAFAEAREKARTGDLSGALDAIVETERYMKHPTVSLLKARVLRRMFKLDRAQATLDTINPGKLKRKLRAVLAEEQKRLKEAMATRGHLRVDVSPKGARIVVLGEITIGRFDAWVAEGKHRVEVSAPGFQPAVRPVSIEAGQLREIKIKLRSAIGTIKLTVPGGLKGVDLTLDGKLIVLDEAVKAGDMTTFDASMGAHEIICSRGELRDSRVIKVEVGRTVVVSCDGLRPAGAGRIALGWGGVATGLAMAGYGVWGIATYFSDVAIADERMAAASKAPPPEGLVRGGGIETNKHWGGALYLVSGLAVSAGSYLFLLRSPATDTAQRQPAPWPPEPLVASRRGRPERGPRP